MGCDGQIYALPPFNASLINLTWVMGEVEKIL